MIKIDKHKGLTPVAQRRCFAQGDCVKALDGLRGVVSSAIVSSDQSFEYLIKPENGGKLFFAHQSDLIAQPL